MLDDVLDVSGPVERTGKARGTDLLDGTVTLPLILARERDRHARRVDLRGPARRPSRRRSCASGSPPPARWGRPGSGRWRSSPRPRRRFPASLPEDRAELLERVADAVVERYS